MVKDVRSTGKLYVKFANTDSKANAQKLVISGFVNDGKLSSTELNPDLEATGAERERGSEDGDEHHGTVGTQ